MTERVPPHNLDAEESVLGAVLLSRDAIERVHADGLKAEHFYAPRHGHVFDAVTALHRTGVPADAVTVADELRRAGLLDQIGGTDELWRLQNQTPSISAVGQYAAIVRNTYTGRRIIHLAGDLTEVAYSEPDPASYGQQIARITEQITGTVGGITTVTGGLELIDWTAAGGERGELLEGILFVSRWTALNAAAKVGKTTLIVYTGINLSLGVHPFDHTPIPPVTVLHIDAEVGRDELDSIVRACGYDPAELDRWHATDLPPLLNTPEGAERALITARTLDAALVVVDGINGTVDGPEKDDTTWRPFYDLFVRRAKADHRGVLTADNTGHSETGRPRGSSVKLDKPDAIVNLRRIDEGARLRVTHRRSAEFAGIDLAATGFDGGTVRYSRHGGGWIAGTKEAAQLLDDLDVPIDVGRPVARAALTGAYAKALANGEPDADRYQLRNDVLSSGIRWRKSLR